MKRRRWTRTSNTIICVQSRLVEIQNTKNACSGLFTFSHFNETKLIIFFFVLMNAKLLSLQFFVGIFFVSLALSFTFSLSLSRCFHSIFLFLFFVWLCVVAQSAKNTLSVYCVRCTMYVLQVLVRVQHTFATTTHDLYNFDCY